MIDSKLEIIPGILEQEWDEIEKKLNKAKHFASSVHIDFIDGVFVDNTTFLDPKPFKEHSQDLLLEAHLMVDNPLQYIQSLANSGFKRFLGHIEKMPNVDEFITTGKRLGEVGIAIDGPTDITTLNSTHLSQLDCVLIYAAERVGFAGAPMMDERLTKVKELREKTTIPIEIDGGVKDHNLSSALSAGATRFVATSFLWSNPNPQDEYQKLISLLHQE